ncbi:MAG TPA: arginine--tRNA ligase [Terriglobales bacterium]|nr:arginine--tRNA ligase [Terriglobales bacterium]
MYRDLERRLALQVREFVRRAYAVDLARVVIEQPPRVELGEYALPLAFELAKKLRKAPRVIAQEIVAGIGPIDGFDLLELAGAGYINARVNRAALASALAADDKPSADIPGGKILVEHSSINPNKAAHIGHLRNAILGDTFVRLLRFAGREVDVQNYIDNTGVQVADVIVGFLHLEKKQWDEVEELSRQPRFDYYCWELYARVSQWYEQDRQNLKHRVETLHAIEQGNNEIAAIADLISTAVLRRHLETMDRLDIEYDFLPRESEILHLHFWDAAFEKLKASGVLTFETEGKNKGCWIMRRAGTAKSLTAEDAENAKKDKKKNGTDAVEGEDVLDVVPLESGMDLRPDSSTIAEEDQKVIVRSNGTVGYVGKDIAYHMWKFGVLGKDFGYKEFYRYPNQHQCWISTVEGEPEHPHFGGVSEIYNVIDARQSEAQSTVIEALRGLGYNQQADHYTHFSYEMVALTPRCAAELGYQLSEEDKARSYIEVSGRKGFGVKADDLLDALIASAKEEVDARNAHLHEDKRRKIATQIAVGALRYFMLKYTKSSVIAFDFKDALSFEGETGPYAQYAVVRATNIFRKGELDPEKFLTDECGQVAIRPEDLRVDVSGGAARITHIPTGIVATSDAGKSERQNRERALSMLREKLYQQSSSKKLDFSQYLAGDSANDIWELWLAAAKTSYIVDQCIATTEPAYLAKHAFQLAQLFNTFYHRYPILSEADEGRRRFLLATAAVVRRELIHALAVMGISTPGVM